MTATRACDWRGLCIAMLSCSCLDALNARDQKAVLVDCVENLV